MMIRRRSNRFHKRFPNHACGMNVVFFYNNISGHVAESNKIRTNKKNKVTIAPKTENGKKNETK